MHARLLPAVAALAALSACVDLKPAPAPPIRWLTLAEPADERAADSAPPVVAELSVAGLRASDAIGESLVRRQTDFELAYDEGARWVEPPEQMVERALHHELFRRRGFRASSRAARHLEVELLSFEESLAPRRQAVVSLTIKLSERGAVILDQRVRAVQPVDSGDPAEVASALTAALDDAVTRVADVLAAR